MQINVYVYIAVMAIVTYLIRTLPLTLVRKEIKNGWIRRLLNCGEKVTIQIRIFHIKIFIRQCLFRE